MLYRRIPRVLALFALLSSPLAGQSFSGDTDAVNGFDGGTQAFTIDAGATFAGESYLVLGSLSGTVPGIPLPLITVPLNFDAYLLFGLTNPNSSILPGSSGVLDSQGRAQSSFVLPALSDPSLPEFVIHHAVLVNQGGAFSAVSDPLSVLVSVEGSLAIQRPREGAVVGTATIDVEGRLPAAFTGLPGVTVTVAGVPAVISSSASGFDQFLAPELRLAPGVNTLDVVAEGPGMPSEMVTLTVNHQPLRANNLAIQDGFIYATLGSAGLGVVNSDTREAIVVSPPAGSGTIDDVSIDGDLLFTLDAAGAGQLSVFDIRDRGNPLLVSGPVSVPVGPFAAVSASGGRVVVSGGTSRLRVYEYSAGGQLSNNFGDADLGIGQPDVLIAADGESAFVSTDFSGFFDGAGFGITLIDLNTPPVDPSILDRIGLIGSGFTPGAMSPANFPIESARLGQFVLTAHGGGLSVIMPGVGTALTTLDLPFAGTSVDAVGNRAYVVGEGPARRLAVVDVSNPSSPILVRTRSFSGPGVFTGVATDGEIVAIASNQGGVIVVDAE